MKKKNDFLSSFLKRAFGYRKGIILPEWYAIPFIWLWIAGSLSDPSLVLSVMSLHSPPPGVF
jgi:hypothetical protein